MNRAKALYLGLLLPVLQSLGGCAVGPDYAPPAADDPSDWSLKTSSAAAVDPVSEWWQTFDDPELDRLVETALARNHDIRQAYERVAEARALSDRVSARLAPSLAANAAVTRRRLSENGALPAGRIPGLDTYQTIFDIGFDASWEIDVFRQTASRLAAANADVDRTIAESADIALLVTAEVARNYLEMRGAQAELRAQQRSLAAAERTLALVETRYRVGDAPAADVARARADFANLGTDVPAIESAIRLRALALGALTGRNPEAELSLLDGTAGLPPLDAVPVGERADILRRRADVRIAERRIAAATANQRVATAELFPKLVIGASGGFESLEADTLLDSPSATWNVVPQVSWRIFDGGRVRAEIRASEARVRQAALGYEKVVIGALTDAEQSLGRYHFALEQVDRQRAALDAARESFRLTNARYVAGDVSLFERLDAERALARAERGLARVHATAATSLVALYKALGGGWQEAHASVRLRGDTGVNSGT